MIAGIIIAYIVTGVVVQVLEELWLMKYGEEVMQTNLDECDVHDEPFISRIKHYNFEWLCYDLKSVIRWPIDYVILYNGMMRIRNDENVKAEFIKSLKGE